jgi:hypothetical protein
MNIIPEEIVEKTRREIAGFSPVRANKEMMKIGNSQPELLAFVTELTEEMDLEVKELGIYMFFVVYRMFEKTQGKIKRISSEQIIECHEHNESSMERLERAHEKLLDRAAHIQISKQPFVTKYVVDALMEQEEGEDAIELTDEDKGFLFLLLKTVIDVLDQKSVKS